MNEPRDRLMMHLLTVFLASFDSRELAYWQTRHLLDLFHFHHGIKKMLITAFYKHLWFNPHASKLSLAEESSGETLLQSKDQPIAFPFKHLENMPQCLLIRRIFIINLSSWVSMKMWKDDSVEMAKG